MKSIIETCLQPDICNIPEALQIVMIIGAIHTSQAIIRTLKDFDVKDLSTLLHIIGLFTVARLVFRNFVRPRPSLSAEAPKPHIPTSPNAAFPGVPIFPDDSRHSQRLSLELKPEYVAQMSALPDLLSNGITRVFEQSGEVDTFKFTHDNQGPSSASCDTGVVDTNTSTLLRRRPGQYFKENTRARPADLVAGSLHQNNFDQGKETVAGTSSLQTATYPNGYVLSELYLQTQLAHEYDSTGSTFSEDDLPVITAPLASPFSYQPPALTVHQNEAGLLMHNEKVPFIPWPLDTALYPGQKGHPGSSLLFARSPPGLRLPDPKAPPGVPFCNFREGVPGQIIVEVGRKFNLRTLRSLTNGKPPTSAIGMVVSSHDEPLANYYALELLIQSMEMKELLASVQTISITTPRDFFPTADAEGGPALEIPIVPELRDFTCNGNIGSLPRNWHHLKNLPLEQLLHLSLVNCSVSLNDCLSVLSRCTNLNTCQVDCLSNCTSMISDSNAVTRVSMNQLDHLSVVAGENVDLGQFFQIIRANSMSALSLRLPRNATPNKLFLPWKTLQHIYIYNDLDCIDELRRKTSEAKITLHCNY